MNRNFPEEASQITNEHIKEAYIICDQENTNENHSETSIHTKQIIKN